MNLKIFVYKTGKSLTEIKQVVDKALKEAHMLGVETDEMFIESTVANMLDMNDQEYSECIRDLNRKFIESKFDSFDEFLESLVSEEMISTGFAPGERPEKLEMPKPKKKEDDKEEE